MKKSLLSVLIFSLVSTFTFGQIKFLSPAEGVWGNKQMLIIENQTEGEYYYSVNGADPEQSGFAYDGPVLLDIEGDISLNVTHVGLDGTKEYGQVDFSVNLTDGNNGDFISKFSNAGFYDYIAGEEFSIPSNLFFSLEKDCQSFIPGTVLKVDGALSLGRLIPCTVADYEENVQWRFVIKVNPFNMGILSHREVPFTIDDWSTITFNDDSLIYKIDSEYWGLPEEPVEIDRSISHMISWQSIDYKAGNTIEYFVLPPKAQIGTRENPDGSIVYYIDGDETYSLGILPAETPELFQEITLDVFYGDKIAGDINLGIYCDSVYQGQVTLNYDIDKLPPRKPVINGSCSTFYSRNSVDINITGDEDSDLYVAVSEPYVIKNTNEVYKKDNHIFNNVIMNDYKLIDSKTFDISFPSVEEKVVYYKVVAYAEKNGLKSVVADYSVVIDQSSYYYNKNSGSEIAEGTVVNPFVSFDQCIEAIKDIRTVSLSVEGDLYIDKKYVINSNLKIINAGDARIIFGPNGSLEIDGSTLEITDCRVHKIPSFSVKTVVPFFKLNHGTLDLKNCQIAADFSKNATVIDSVNSIVNVQDSIIAVSADSYTSFISCIDCRVSIFNSSITATGGTSVIISATNGELDIYDNKFKIIGGTGRIAELFGVNGRFENNQFIAEIRKSGKTVNPIFANKKTVLIDEGNTKVGF